MTSYQNYVTITAPNHLVLSDLPFAFGQRIKVVIIMEDNQQLVEIETLKMLFKITQTLPKAQTISIDEIAAEIATYHSKYKGSS